MTVFDTPSSAEPARIDTPRGPLSYVDEGPADGAPLLLVHGLPGSARDFRWLTPGLSPTFRTVRLEMPGFGGSPLATEPSPAVEPRGRVVIDFADALGLDRPVLIGHSMGGVVSTAAVDLAPERFRGLALISSPGLRIHRGFRQFPRHAVSRGLRTPGVGFAMRKLLPGAFRRSGFRHGSLPELEHTIHCVAATTIREHAARLRRVRLPAFHAFCDDDPLVDADIAAETAYLLGGPTLRFPDGGHNPQKRHAVELSRGLTAWATDLA